MCTSVVQIVRSLTQVTTCYLTTFHYSLSNRNALGPAFFESLDSIVEDCLILDLQQATCSVNNILIVNKFLSFHEFLQFWKQYGNISHWGQDWQIQLAMQQFEISISDDTRCLW